MATSLTFDTLITDLQSYLERGTVVDPTANSQLPRIINLAERNIAHALKIQGFITLTQEPLIAGQSLYTKPAEWRETVSMKLLAGSAPKRTDVFPRVYEFVRSYWPDHDLVDRPKFYADYDDVQWLIAPTPDQAYVMEIMYFQLLPLLDSGNQTNWLTTHAPQVLLNGTLLLCSRFLKNDERVPLWEAAYKEGLGLLNGEDLRKIIDRSSQRGYA